MRLFRLGPNPDSPFFRGYYAALTKVLLIDDDKQHSELLQAHFKRFGIHHVRACEAESGFRPLNREDPDL